MLQYGQVPREFLAFSLLPGIESKPGIASCSCRSDIYLGGRRLALACLFIDHRHKFLQLVSTAKLF